MADFGFLRVIEKMLVQINAGNGFFISRSFANPYN